MQANKLYVFLTIDTEASMHQMQPLSPELMIYGKIDGRYYGIPWIIETCDRFGCQATFFVSALEALHYGEAMVKEVCDTIASSGHDVQLHIHSAWHNGRKFLWENNLEEQISLIGEGAGILERLTGERPIAHRAGGLGANPDTLRALKQNNIPIDSSMYYRGPNCKLWTHIPTINSICLSEGVLEVPVTQFDQIGLGNWKSYRTFDINADILNELKLVIRQAKEQSLRAVNLLMHSFSFIHRSPDRTTITSNYVDMRRFEKLLTYLVQDPEVEVITFKEFYLRHSESFEALTGSDYLPRAGLNYVLLRSVRHFNRSWKNRATVLSAVTLLFAVMGTLLYLL